MQEIEYYPVAQMTAPASQFILKATRDSDGRQADLLVWLLPEDVAEIQRTGKIRRGFPRNEDQPFVPPEIWTVNGWRLGYGYGLRE